MESLASSRVSLDFHSLLYSSYTRNPSCRSKFRNLFFIPSVSIDCRKATNSHPRSRPMSRHLQAGTLVGSSVVDPLSESIVDELKSKEWEIGALKDELAATQGIRIRRQPPTSPPLHYVGPFEFRLQNEENAPRNILEEIVWNKDAEVTQMKEKHTIDSLKKKAIESVHPPRDFIGALKASYLRTGFPGLIAEVKKASPSRGVLREDFDPVEVAKAYEKGGAACLSVLTDAKYFQGSFENLEAIRNAGVQCPLLCKEFIVDAWQLYYARTKGADAVLLIAAVLPDLDIKYMLKICKMIGLTALVEVHDENEMDRMLALDGIELIGINNRNLETFKVDISNTKRLLEGERGEKIRQKDIIVVGESGLFTPADIAYVQEAGVKAKMDIDRPLPRECHTGCCVTSYTGCCVTLGHPGCWVLDRVEWHILECLREITQEVGLPVICVQVLLAGVRRGWTHWLGY